MRKRILSVFIAMALLFQVFWPSISFALTSGPSQPEMGSFEPVTANQMVDPFTGDFTYNLPLLVVPGPNGGYPINLSYHAGIGMEQEASWTGLGWNINAGVINRQLRGLADDYKGDILIKKMNIKPSSTLAYGNVVPFAAAELWGFNFQLNVSQENYYNSYKGVGFCYGLGISAMQNNIATDGGLSGSLSIKHDSQAGFDIETSLSLSSIVNSGYTEFSFGTGYNSREGMQSVSLGVEKHNKEKTGSTFKKAFNNSYKGAGVSFCKSSYIPSISMPMTGSNKSGTIKTGGEIMGTNANAEISASYTLQYLKTHEVAIPSYGYNYSEYRKLAGDIAALDFNRENDATINDNIPNLPLPVFTYDVYNVKGQGVGSVFRAFRSDVGILYDASIESEITGGAFGSEVGASSGTKAGANIGIHSSHSYSGKWKSNDEAIVGLNFQDEDYTSPLYESYYFKSSGEQTANTIAEDEAWKTADDDPVRLNLSMQMGDSAFYPRIVNQINGTSTSINNARRSEREKRVQSIEKKTMGQIVNSAAYNNRPDQIFSYNQFPSSTISGSKFEYQTSYSKDHHIAEISVLNPDGTRYKYSIPAYNTVQKDVMFAIDGSTINPYDHEHFTTYNSADASITNAQGEDNFFTSTELPAYAHSYLLTEIVSDDYVDLTGNGPTTDDFGYYVKFNYSKNDTLYRWRIPYFDANYIKGYDSNSNDDKASYSYGNREEYYLNSVETKTHIAEFHLSDRHDGYGAHTEYNQSSDKKFDSSQKLKKIDEIRLYSKNDRTTSVKTIHFEYNYELCANVQNNDGASEIINSEDINASKGKLTLKKVWFTYGNNNKGQYSPYQFNYHAENTDENPDYSLMQMDRWGNYKPDDLPSNSNVDNPYVDQTNKTDADAYAGAWNLKSITLPSGGIMNIEYEADDYAYVQNVPATQMMKILYTGDDAGNTTSKLNVDNRRVYFEPECPLEDFSTDADKLQEVHRYIKGLNEMYFKAYLYLKPKISVSNGLNYAYDYVRGYAELDTTDYGYESIDGKMIPYITVKAVNVSDKNNNSGTTHPFRKAAWQYMKVQRPDLLYPAVAVDGPLDQAVNNVATMIEDLGELLTGYYNFCNVSGYGSNIHLDAVDENGSIIPSFIRLNSPDQIKFGGGHRVKKISISDEWNSMTGEKSFSYGQQYEYKMPDGSSSGVAEYEPLVGGDENALHKPIRYSTEKYLSKVQDNALFLEEPLGEAFYPSPNIGYRRILVKALEHAGVTKSASGITEYKFYTAKEFPIEVKSTDLDNAAKYQMMFAIPFFGTAAFNIRAYSQGYAIYLNDMHGKMRSMATYAANAVLYGNEPDLSQPVSESIQLYLTTTTFDESKTNSLKNTVTVMDADGVYRQSELGINRDFYTDERENESKATNISLDGNLDFQGPNIFVPTAFPVFDFNVGQFRSIVTTKIISQTGILSEVKETSEGSTVSSRNLMYDAETGAPLLTSITNEFDAPVYQYNYAAHWNYNGMKGAYKNIGAKFEVVTNTNGLFTFTDTETFFAEGDELTETSGSSRKTYYVQEVFSNSVKILKEDGNVAANLHSNLEITRSGHRNLQSQLSGNIISLTDPVNGSNIQKVLDAFNATVGTIAPLIQLHGTTETTFTAYDLAFKFYDCYSGDSIPIVLSNHISSNLPDSITFYLAIDNSDGLSDDCISYITFPKKILDPQDYYLTFENNEILAENLETGEKLICTWDNPSQCFSRCIDDVLNASATTYKNDWNFNYTDVGSPVLKDVSGIIISDASVSPYRYGRKGIYKPEKNYVCLTERKQASPTDISKDGTYKIFSPFEWLSAATNPTWTMSNEITQYSPYGFETENKDALNIYSSALYGYNNSLVTAVASNASYSELAYDGFEDYTAADLSVNPGHGHFNFQTVGNGKAFKWPYYSHTGEYSLQVSSLNKLVDTLKTGNAINPSYIQLKANTEYLISAWVYLYDSNTKASIKIRKGSTVLAEQFIEPSATAIEGWRKIDIKFTAPLLSKVIVELQAARITGSSGTYAFFDDIRLRPFKSSIKSFVYDPVRLLLKAELDDQNYATFYNYDEEGILTQTKKETERGIMTIQSTRSNTRKAN